MAKLRIGVMGCASIAQRSVIPAVLLCDELKLIAVASRTEERAKEFAASFGCDSVVGYDKLLERADIDAIYMPLPTGLHEEWVTKSLQAGKHVLVEKSLAMDHSSGRRMVDLARASNLLLMENFMFLYHSQHEFVRDLVAAGEIGELRSFRSSFGFPPLPINNFRYNKALGGGALLDAAAYTIRASQLFLGEDLVVKAANLISPDGQEVDIYGGAYLSNAAGAFAEVSFGFDNYYQCNYELWGSKGKIIAQRAFTPGPDFRPTITLEQQSQQFNHEVHADNHFVNILKEFARCVREAAFGDKYKEVENQSKLLSQVRELASD